MNFFDTNFIMFSAGGERINHSPKAESNVFLPLKERISTKSNAKRLAELFILFLLLSLLWYRFYSLLAERSFVFLIAFFCEAWFTFVWLLYINAKWSPVFYKTNPDHLLKQFDVDELPALDMFVTTADPKLEPPIITVNTVLSLLAVEYPANHLACYVSDDGGSPITYYSLVEASKFASHWIPYCKKYDIKVRAPFMYFSQGPNQGQSLDFLHDWKAMKKGYQELCQKIEDAEKSHFPPLEGDDFAEFFNIERGNHQSIVKILCEDKDWKDGVPHLIYVSREKRPKHHHHFKAGAMNALTRVSALMTNAPFFVNVDCDMFANNPKVILHGMCLLLGFKEDEASCGYAQIPQRFYGGLKDDPFGNQLEVLQKFVGEGIAGIQGPLNSGTGCFYRRKAIYGSSPSLLEGQNKNANEWFSSNELKIKFGNSRELMESANEIIMPEAKPRLSCPSDLSSRKEIAKQVVSSTFEQNTSWGKEIGWAYGSMAEDILTGLRMHSMGWKSIFFNPDPPGYLGSAPTGGPESLTQYKRWAMGLMEVLFHKHINPVVATFTKRLQFRQCLAYLLINIWALRSVPELAYALLPAYSLITGTSFLPKASETQFLLAAALLISYVIHGLAEYKQCGKSYRAWWNNQRMQRISVVTAFLLGFFSAAFKFLGVSDTGFEITRKDQLRRPAHADPGRFTFDGSPVFISGTALVLVHMAAAGAGLMRRAGGPEMGGPGVGEMVCSGWVIVTFWPFVRGLIGKGSYGIPWLVVIKAGVWVVLFLLLCI